MQFREGVLAPAEPFRPGCTLVSGQGAHFGQRVSARPWGVRLRIACVSGNMLLRHLS
jgi:hypothetical protein